MAKVTAVTTVFPDTGVPRIHPQSKNSDSELNQTVFRTEDARMLSAFYLNLLFLPCGHVLPRGGWFYGWSSESYITIGHCVRCACAVQNRLPR